jgi:type IV pilus assembly protein PilN
MIKINLLDWREAKREQRQKQFLISLAGTAALGAVVVLAMNMKVTGDLEFQRSRNDHLRAEITAMDKQIAEIKALEKVKTNLLARMRVIEELQRSRTEIVHFFDEVLTTAPAGLYITELAQSGRTTKVSGVAESNGRVSSYIRNLDASPWFEKAKLIVIRTDDKNRRRQSDFQLQFNLSKQSGSTEEDAG